MVFVRTKDAGIINQRASYGKKNGASLSWPDQPVRMKKKEVGRGKKEKGSHGKKKGGSHNHRFDLIKTMTYKYTLARSIYNTTYMALH